MDPSTPYMEDDMRTVLALVLLLVAVGCDNPFGPDLPGNAVESEPPTSYDDWWAIVEADSGVRGDFGAVRWFKVSGGPWDPGDGSAARGLWTSSGNRIYIADTHWMDGSVVRHEMLHAILRDPGHTHPLFSTPAYNYAMSVR